MSGRFAHNAAFAYQLAADLKLWLHEDDPITAGSEQRRESGNEQSDGDEANVADDELHGFADVRLFKVAGIETLVQNDARMGAQFPIDLAGAGIDAVNARGAVLQQAIGEATGGGSHVETNFTGGIDGKLRESGFEFQATAAYVFQWLGDDDVRRFSYGMTGFVGFLAIDGDFSRKDEGLRFLTRFDQALIQHGDVEPLFHVLRCTMKSAIWRRRPARSSKE